MNKISEKVYDLGYVKINTISFGRGKPLFLLPGFTFSAKIFKLLKPYLASNYLVTGMDLPGWGGKSKFTKNQEAGHQIGDYVKVIKDTLEMIYSPNEVINIGGVSVGGTLSLLVACQYQGKLDKIFVQSPPCDGLIILQTRKLETRLAQLAQLLPFFRPLVRSSYEKHLLRVYQHCQANINQQLKTELQKDYQRLKTEEILNFACDLFSSDFKDVLKGVTAKVIIVGGVDDKIIPLDYLENLSQKILPGAIFLKVEKATHFFLAEDPGRFATLIKNHV